MRFNDAVIGSVLIVFAAAVLFHTRNFPTLETGYPGPALFPNCLSFLFILAGIILVFRGIKSRSRLVFFDGNAVNTSGVVNIFFVLGAILFYIFVAEYLGFIITAFITIFILMLRLKAPVVASLIMTCGVVLAIYVLFAKILLVPLPWGLFGW